MDLYKLVSVAILMSVVAANAPTEPSIRYNQHDGRYDSNVEKYDQSKAIYNIFDVKSDQNIRYVPFVGKYDQYDDRFYQNYGKYDQKEVKYEDKHAQDDGPKFVAAPYLPTYGQIDQHEKPVKLPSPYGVGQFDRMYTERFGNDVLREPPTQASLTPYQRMMIVLMNTVAGTSGGSNALLDSVRA